MMAHLWKFRKGWQSEHLAKFILSKFSFVTEPTTIADDLGSDFLCTLFSIYEEKVKTKTAKFLLPRNSFAIQIKSDRRRIDVTNKINYFNNLQIPFFVGVVNKKNLELKIYSGESIPHFFSCEDIIKRRRNGYKTFIKLFEDKDYPRRDHHFINYDDNKKECYLEFPRILPSSIKVDYDYELAPNEIDELFKVCELIQRNISHWKSHSYIYTLHGYEGINLYASHESAKKFRDNLYRGLAGVFHNLKWIYEHEGKINADEYEVYKCFFNQLQTLVEKKQIDPLPIEVIATFNALDELLTKD